VVGVGPTRWILERARLLSRISLRCQCCPCMVALPTQCVGRRESPLGKKKMGLSDPRQMPRSACSTTQLHYFAPPSQKLGRPRISGSRLDERRVMASGAQHGPGAGTSPPCQAHCACSRALVAFAEQGPLLVWTIWTG
jgi:hypothetical protein